MSIKQHYKIEDLAFSQIVTVKDTVGEGSTVYSTLTERELTGDELALLDEVLTDSINITRTLNLRRKIAEVEAEGYRVEAL